MKKEIPYPVPKEKRTEEYWKLLNKIIDPDLGIGIVDLGLIYKVDIKDHTATVEMTFTTPSCPLGPYLISEVERKMTEYKGVEKVYVEIVWQPFWSQDLIDPEIQELMMM